jgi:hypothetical protein
VLSEGLRGGRAVGIGRADMVSTSRMGLSAGLAWTRASALGFVTVSWSSASGLCLGSTPSRGARNSYATSSAAGLTVSLRPRIAH